MSDLEAKSLSTPEKIFRQKILENFLGKNFSRKFVKFLSGWKNFQKSCQDRKICRIPKKLLSGEKFDIPGKNCQIPENFGPDRKIARFREKLPDSGKSGKVAVRTGISRFRPETSQELPVSTGNPPGMGSGNPETSQELPVSAGN
jgi:hypothetical protein